MKTEIRAIAFDLDGTLTQHKSPLGETNRKVLDKLAEKYQLLMVGAGMCRRIYNQMGQYPIDIVGNYGLQTAKYDREVGDLVITEDHQLPCDRASVEERVTYLRRKYGYTDYKGDNVEYHASGCVTFPLLGTAADLADKLCFDPDRSKRRAIYEDVKSAFTEYTVFVGGSSSFDMAPSPYNKYYALDKYCKEQGLEHSQVLYVGDDYGPGGNDESVYLSDFPFIRIDDYREFAGKMREYADSWTLNRDNIWVAGHRGWPDKYPENTMESYRAAVDAGVDQLEIDVRVTADGELVLIHDNKVDRTTDGTGPVCEMTLAELKALDAGVHKGEAFKGCRIPTFIEFMDYVSSVPGLTVDIELKEYPTEGREDIAYEVCDRVLKIVDEYEFTDRVVVNTFSAKLHEYIYKKYGKKYRQHTYYPRNHGEIMDSDEYSYCRCMFGTADNPGEVISPKAEVERTIGAGVQPWAGAAVRNRETVQEAIDKGMCLITCNNPDKVLALLRECGKHR